MPQSWSAIVLRDPLGREAQRGIADAEAGRVLRIRRGSHHIFWPYRGTGGTTRSAVPGVEHVLASAGDMAHDRLMEAMLVQLDGDGDLASPGGMPAIGAAEAFALGMVDEGGCSSIERAAHARTRKRMDQTVAHVENDDDRRQLREVMHDVDLFASLCGRLRVEFKPALPWWSWPRMQSLAAEVDAGMPSAQIRALTPRLLVKLDWVLKEDQRDAWHVAFGTYRPLGDLNEDWM